MKFHYVGGLTDMDLNLIWKAILIVLFGTFLLRIAGRKSVSQMTIAQTVLMVSIGTLLIQPVVGKNIWTTFIVGSVLVLTLLVMEYAELKADNAESFITGKSKILIKNGMLQERNLKKTKMTVDQLEMNLRQKNVMRISDVEWATIEPNGQVGFTLKEDAQPITKREFNKLDNDLQQIMTLLGSNTFSTPTIQQNSPQTNQDNIFTEIEQGEDKNPPPNHLQ